MNFINERFTSPALSNHTIVIRFTSGATCRPSSCNFPVGWSDGEQRTQPPHEVLPGAGQQEAAVPAVREGAVIWAAALMAALKIRASGMAS